MIGSENHQGVVCDPQFIECRQQATNIEVNVAHHSIEPGVCLVDTCIPIGLSPFVGDLKW